MSAGPAHSSMSHDERPAGGPWLRPSTLEVASRLALRWRGHRCASLRSIEQLEDGAASTASIDGLIRTHDAQRFP